MINRTEVGLSKALQELENIQDDATALNKPHANDSEVAARPPAIADSTSTGNDQSHA